MKSVHILLLIGLLGGCQNWSDPTRRGSLMIYDRPVVPAIYHGEWASPRRACRATGDYGTHLRVTAQSVEFQPVVSVEGYSDFEDIVLTVRRDNGTDQRLFLDIANDHRRIRVSTGYGSRETILWRCSYTKAP